MFKKNIIALSLFTLSTMALGAEDYIEITPFIWNANLSGRVQISSQKAHIDRDKLSGVVLIEAEKYKIGIISEITYARLTDSYRRNNYKISVNNSFGIFNLFLSYNFTQNSRYYFKLYAGGRYTQKTSNLLLTTNSIQIKMNQNLNWVDPVIGINLKYHFNSYFFTKVFFDIGGTNFSNDYSYEAIGLIGIRKPLQFAKASLYIGYQILDQHYITTKNQYINWNVKLSGPLLGIGIQIP